jgi:NADH-quinone oxidoreductase subunit H
MVSYEVPMVLALLIPVLLSRSMGVNSIVQSQQVWYIVLAPIAAFFFFITSLAETGRAPFDLLEAESEIVAGYQTEYSGLKFGMFFVGEFLHAFTISALTVTLFLGGWRGPGSEQVPLLGTAYFFIKTFFVYFIVLWVRISLPRLRIDQMLNFNWKFLTPIALVMLMATAVLEKILSEWLPTLNLTETGMSLIRTFSHLGLNVLVVAGVLQILRSYTIRREKVGQPRPLAIPPEPPATALE